MQFTVQTTQGLERRIEVQVPHTRVAGEVERRLRDLSRTANIRGFRKGKVPLNVIKQQFGAQAHGDAVSELIRQTYTDAVQKEKLRPAAGPRIEPIQVDPGQDLKFAAIIEVMPEVVINPVAALEIERPVFEITEEDVDAMLESMRRQRATFSPVERAAKKGDRVVVDFTGRVDGKEFEGGSGQGMSVVIGSGRAIADFENALEGMSKGESKTAPVKFPDDYGAKELAGKQAEFDLTVTSVEEQVLPTIDDEFAKAFGLEGGLEALRKEVRGSMEREAAEAVRNKVRNQVFEALARENQVELPRALVEEQIQQLQIDLLQRMGRQPQDASQLPPRDPFVEPAERRVKLGLLIGELIRRENIQIERGRVLARLDEIASAYPNPAEVRRAWLQDQQAMAQVETAVMEDLAVEWVLGRARVNEKKVGFADLTGFRKPE
jgi:trigger factor